MTEVLNKKDIEIFKRIRREGITDKETIKKIVEEEYKKDSMKQGNERIDNEK